MAHEILTNRQMAEADRAAIEGGVPGFTLMQKAGQAVVEEIQKRYAQSPVLVLCGPGNNGGDGYVIAALLKKAGWPVRVAALAPEKLKGDALLAARLWDGPVESFESLKIEKGLLVVDAVFGTGFSGELRFPVLDVFKQIEKEKPEMVAVDMPTGACAALTVTFCRKKLSHVLEPMKSQCGEIIVRDIGIGDDAVMKAGSAAKKNHPDLWLSGFPFRKAEDHKYKHGHAVIIGAAKMTGATRLAAAGCARIGAGLTTVIAPEETGEIYRRTLEPHIIVKDRANLKEQLVDERITAILIGPGAGSDYESIRSDIKTICRFKEKHIVLDADALNCLAAPSPLIPLPHEWGRGKWSEAEQGEGAVVMTPHEGEFARLFPDLDGNKIEKAVAAAKRLSGIIVYKGSDTVIAMPDKAVVNTNAPPDLATAGTGDVLAGMITGLLAQGMEPFDAACASVWVHGEAARRFGAGLVASDLPELIPGVLRDLA